MENEHIIGSTLKVVASENINIIPDLLSEQTKSIAQLIENNTNEEKEEESGQTPLGG